MAHNSLYRKPLQTKSKSMLTGFIKAPREARFIIFTNVHPNTQHLSDAVTAGGRRRKHRDVSTGLFCFPTHTHRVSPFSEPQERHKPQGRAVPTSTTQTQAHRAAPVPQGGPRTRQISQKGSVGHREMLRTSSKSSTARPQTSPAGRRPGPYSLSWGGAPG